MKTLLFLAAISFFGCNTSSNSTSSSDSTSQEHQLVKKWETDSTLKVPESVLFDKANQVLYVSNTDGTEPWAADGKGSIGKIGLDGKVIAAEWVTGLNAPKGMGLYNGKLYAADLTNLVIIDIASGKIERSVAIAGATGLNDISIDGKGVIYISDSQSKKVFRYENDKAELFLENLEGPNGVLIHENDLYVLDNGGMYKVNADKSLTKITDGMEGGADGIENIEGKDYIVSCLAGAIWYVDAAAGTKQLLLDTRPEQRNTADIGFDPETKTVYVPTFLEEYCSGVSVRIGLVTAEICW